MSDLPGASARPAAAQIINAHRALHSAPSGLTFSSHTRKNQAASCPRRASETGQTDSQTDGGSHGKDFPPCFPSLLHDPSCLAGSLYLPRLIKSVSSCSHESLEISGFHKGTRGQRSGLCGEQRAEARPSPEAQQRSTQCLGCVSWGDLTEGPSVCQHTAQAELPKITVPESSNPAHAL